jgi:hypothetical protein
LLDFNGLTGLLRDNVSCQAIENSSELILNTVDFRSGNLFAFSDQERFSIQTPEDVVQGALASAVLPVIVRPVYRFSTDRSGSPPHAYLDGGIRSELPIMPVVRRGAERVLVIGSSASVPGGTGNQPAAVDLAARYIDVSLAGVIETELAQSQSYAAGLRLAEQELCEDELGGDARCPAGDCDAKAVCGARWDEMCRPPAAPGPSDAPSSNRAPRPTLSERLRPLWKLGTIFRDERRIEPLHGYVFDRNEQRRLFLAGAEAVRVSCVRVARLLGIADDDPRKPLPDYFTRNFATWCAPELPADVCGAPDAHARKSAKDCSSEVEEIDPELFRMCRGAGGAP